MELMRYKVNVVYDFGSWKKEFGNCCYTYCHQCQYFGLKGEQTDM